MSSPTPSIRKILGPQGTLSKVLQNFEHRPSQIKMADLILEALEIEQFCLVEAGTGTGKTFGYLLPAALSGKKIVISTGTKNLQEQIYYQDIPLVAKALGQPLETVLMKGRQNYLCLYKFFQYFAQGSFLKPEAAKTRKKIEAWLEQTKFADRAELTWLADSDPLWINLSTPSDQCLGARCFHHEECYLNRLRQEAAQSRIVIVNHHLFFADLMVKQGGFGEIIPRFEAVIFDEAHLIEDIATTYFGESISTNQLMDLAADAEKQWSDLPGPELKKMKLRLDEIRLGAGQMQEHFLNGPEKGTLDEKTVQLLEMGPAHTIRKGLRYLQERLETSGEAQETGASFATRAEDLAHRLKTTLTLHSPDWLNWFERHKKSLQLHTSPLNIASELQASLYKKNKTVILTSATLSTGGNFDYICNRLGIGNEALAGIYPSHFHFSEQALLYVPKDLGLPNEPDFAQQAGQRIMQILQLSAGRALVLFTSHHNLNLAHQLLQGRLPYTLFKQGEAPPAVLLKAFKEDTHSVLLATGSFWQGVDVPGEALSCLIIDKLPFDAPGDPLVAARIASIRSRNGNPFLEYQIPAAIIALKQGVGRLIRTDTDRGVIAILDRRLIDSRYGHFFFESLPDIPQSHKLEDVGRFFR